MMYGFCKVVIFLLRQLDKTVGQHAAHLRQNGIAVADYRFRNKSCFHQAVSRSIATKQVVAQV